MKSIRRLIDHLLIRFTSWTGAPVQGLADYLEVDCLPGYLDPESPQRRPSFRPRFV